MGQISFYPGPSRVNSKVPEFIYDAYGDGILSVNHRSETFMELYAKTKKILRKNLGIPEDYEIAFFSSATECWEVIIQSLATKSSQHFYNGAFGMKWCDYAEFLTGQAKRVEFHLNEKLPVEEIDPKADCICITQNETSNGTAVDNNLILGLQKMQSKDQLIAVDATSSMGGIDLRIKNADIWLASVQKCFGLPSGLAVMVLSPKAVERTYHINERGHYNSLPFVLENSARNQTHHTPNVLDIYLLYRTVKSSKGILRVDDKITKRYKNWEYVLDDLKQLTWLVDNPEVRSKTVLALSAQKPEDIIKKAANSQFILGKGYGELRDKSLRIANFPALRGKEIEKLHKFLTREIG